MLNAGTLATAVDFIDAAAHNPELYPEICSLTPSSHQQMIAQLHEIARTHGFLFPLRELELAFERRIDSNYAVPSAKEFGERDLDYFDIHNVSASGGHTCGYSCHPDSPECSTRSQQDCTRRC